MHKKNKLMLKYMMLVFLLVAGCFVGNAQKLKDSITLSGDQLKQMMANEETLKEWIVGLQTPGVIVDGDEMKFSDEAIKLSTDEAYRKATYKETYSLIDVKESIGKFEIQKAFWRMINLYPENKEMMLQFIYAYDKTVPADKLVVASFYTYAFFDPRITEIIDGKPSVHRPDTFEYYFRITKEIVAYVAALREQEKSSN